MVSMRHQSSQAPMSKQKTKERSAHEVRPYVAARRVV